MSKLVLEYYTCANLSVVTPEKVADLAEAIATQPEVEDSSVRHYSVFRARFSHLPRTFDGDTVAALSVPTTTFPNQF